MWQPNHCSLLGQKGSEPADLKKVLQKQWILIVGDSNSRHLIPSFCQKGQKEVSKLPLQVCVADSYVITAMTSWPYTGWALESFMRKNLTALLDNIIGTTPLPDAVRSKVEPDFIFLSLGTHTPGASGPEMPRKVLEDFEKVRPEWLAARKVALLLTTTCSSRNLLGNFPGLWGLEAFQNNPRLTSVNKGIMETFNGKAYFLDFASTTHPFTITGDMRDVVHFHAPVYSAHAVMMLTLLDLINKRKL